MKTYKAKFPEITLKYKTGNVLKAKLTSSNDSYEMFKKVFDEDTLELNESAMCIFLNNNNSTIAWFKVSQGGISGTIIDIRLILATALKCNASAILLAHNHPSGNLRPSGSDIKITEKLKSACEVMDIRLLDHLIITSEKYFSLADEGLLK